MKIRIYFSAGLLIFLANLLNAQTLFEDSKGETSIYLPLGGLIRLNTSDESIKFAYYRNRSNQSILIGFDASGKSNNGIAPVFNKLKISPEVSLNFNLGFRNVLTNRLDSSTYDFLVFKAGISSSKFKLIDSTLNLDDQVSSVEFTGINLGAGYNFVLHGNMIFGIFLGYDHTNNLCYLNELKILETKTLSVNLPENTSRTTDYEFTAWAGTYHIINQVSLYADYIYIPDFLDNRIAFSLYLRSVFNNIHKKTNTGIGLYLNQKGNPMKIVGGIIYEFEDIFNQTESGVSSGKKGIIGLVAGFNF